jgi:ribose transport system permease protein
MQRELTTDKRSFATTAKNIFLSPEITVLIPIIILCVVTTIDNPKFLSWGNFSVMFRSLIYLGLVAIGQALVVMTGEIDLSVGANACLSGIVFAIFAVNLNMGVVPSVLMGVLTGAAIGFLNGYLVASFGLVNFITTLATMYLCQGLAATLSNGETISPLPDLYTDFSVKTPLNLSWLFFIFLGIIIIFEIMVRFTTIGRKIKAVGGNPNAAMMAGISKKRVKWGAYVVSGALCGVAGILVTMASGAGSPDFGTGLEFKAIAACAVGGIALSGGRGSILGVEFGVLLLYILSNCLQMLKVENNWQLVIIGVILVLAALIDITKSRKRLSEGK